VADTIGSGDSFLAGFLYQLINGSPAERALEFASAIGAFIATRSGACPAYETSQITELINSAAPLKLNNFI
jgi:fructokinase